MPAQVKPLRELQKPSNSSTTSKAKSSKSFVESPMPNHSWHRAKASEHYHKEIATNKIGRAHV